MAIFQRTNLKLKFKSLRISYNKKSKRIGTKLSKFLNNVISKKPPVVEENNTSTNVIEHCDVFFTPKSSIDLDSDQFRSVPSYVCEICLESRPLDNSFNIKGCSHFYCIECVVKYIKSKLDDNVTRIACPMMMNCEGVLDPDFCRDVLPMDLFNRWGKALCESTLLEVEKFYCPYNDCSALLIDDGDEGKRNNFECPSCKRLFCLKCKVPWHEDLDCTEFQKLKPLGSDARLADLAKRKKWRQCPNPKCNYYVEKIAGCNYVKCKCGEGFCYNCGAKSNGGTHLCSKCRH